MPIRQKYVRRSARRVRSILLTAVVGVGTISPLGERRALASTDKWLLTTSGLWGTVGNWSENALPGLGEDVSISNSFSGSQTIALNITPGVMFHSLTLDATGGGTNVFQTGNNNLSFGPVGETIGNSGNGVFQQQGGADTLTNAVLIIGNYAGSTGTYVISSGATLTASNSNEFVGLNGVGTFAQVGGTNTLGPVLDVGTNSTGTGTYLLTAGNLVANNSSEFIGDGGVGTFQLIGGTHTITGGTLTMGVGSGSTGTYLMIAGLLTCTNAMEIVGNSSGVGSFNQLGGVNSLNGGQLILGSNSFSTASNTYLLQPGATLTANNASEIIGNAGVGIFTQLPGTTNSLDSDSKLYVGNSAGSTGTYTLSGGSLKASIQYVGFSGAGNFNQTGGTNNFDDSVTLGNNAGSTGTYTLGAGGLLTATNGNEYVGKSGIGNFNQTGGTNSIVSFGGLNLGYSSLSTGNYTLSGGSLGAPNEFIGNSGTGNFNQTGGTNSLTSTATLNVGVGSSSTGTYTLSNGALSAPLERVGSSGAGNFNQSGGKNTVAGASSELDLASAPQSSGNYTLSGGTLTASAIYVGGRSTGAGGQGIFSVSNTGSFSVSGTLTIYGSGVATVTGSIASLAYDSVGSLQIAPGGLLTLDNSALTINYGTTPTPNATIRNYISSAYNVNGSRWTGTTGITSSVAAANPGHRSIGFADGADGVVTNLPAGVSSAIPAGGRLPAGNELVMSTFPGDGNLDGKVDFDDFVLISTHFLANDINWDHGNFNYDGIVDFNDFVVLSTNFGDGVTGGDGTGATAAELAQFNSMATSYGISTAQIAAWDATIANLPEPASVGLLGMGMMVFLRRGRKSKWPCATGRQ
jgi:hypothetical protein